jgi:hypothetical protein
VLMNRYVKIVLLLLLNITDQNLLPSLFIIGVLMVV